MTTITTITDLVQYVADHLEAMGVETEDRDALTDTVQEHRVKRYEDHDEADLDELLRAVWADVTDDADWPLGEAAEGDASVTYSYVDDDQCHAYATWTGDRSEALERGMAALHAERVDGEIRYTEDGTEYVVDSEDDIVKLGAALLDGHDIGRVYSLWCAESDAYPADDAA